jgi:hypothetical protein
MAEELVPLFNIQNYLDSFGQSVISQAKINLGLAGKGGGELENSIRFEVLRTDEGISIEFYMADYGTFVDKGVSGNRKNQSFTDWKGETKSSPYKYTTRQPPLGILELWVKKKGLRGRKALIKHRKEGDKKKKIKGAGQFITHKSFAFAIAKSIKRKGIKSISFFQEPFGLGMQTFNPDFLNALIEDIVAHLPTKKT